MLSYSLQEQLDVTYSGPRFSVGGRSGGGGAPYLTVGNFLSPIIVKCNMCVHSCPDNCLWKGVMNIFEVHCTGAENLGG